MLAEMKALATQKNICVLATVAGRKPHCSLMAYVTDENCTELYMVTHKNTKKFKNLMENRFVSLLIDTRETSPRSKAKALTVAGECAVIEGEKKRQKVRSKLLAAHPHLSEFINHSEAEILCVRIRSFLLLNGLQEAHFQTV
ncbi:MAG: pyridoxamine 5'-phosphate oxidase family protein [Deltaproteobacteria bacterium]|jgi:nitroimidazol reductase NimA-like FMN-containing flavoprotein (pyridoxamine 5'-phosphate oxidase superfamily)